MLRSIIRSPLSWAVKLLGKSGASSRKAMVDNLGNSMVDDLGNLMAWE